jgi:hypothetical protein
MTAEVLKTSTVILVIYLKTARQGRSLRPHLSCIKKINMANSKTFAGITPAIWECVKATSLKDHGTKYEPAGAAQGTATTDTLVGTVVLGFNYDDVKDTVAYNIIKKPFLVGADQIWNGVQDTIDGCSKD